MDVISSAGVILCLLLGIIHADDFTGCKSPQYLETGVQGTISCSFDEFFSVYWYNSKNYVTNEAIVEFQNSMKRGKGFFSGEFDVHQDGSLIINNVSLAHDHYFTAVEVISVDNYNYHYVRVIATVKPTDPYPVIENCKHERTVCYQKLPRGTKLKCYVRDARPSISLTWMSITAEGGHNISSVLTITSNGLLNTSTATTTDPLVYTSGISLLSCKAHSLPVLLTYNESLIIVESEMTDLHSFIPIPKYARMNSRLDLSRVENEIAFLVWKHKQTNDEIFIESAYGVYWQNDFSAFQSEGYNLSTTGAISIPEVRPEHEGLHACISSNGTVEFIVVYDITVYVPPDPAYPVVEGCTSDRYCTLEVDRQGTLSCTLKGIRPKVALTWKTFHDSSSSDIIFHNPETIVTTKEDKTFDVLLTAQYDATRSSQTKLTIECKVSEQDSEIFHLTTTFDLLFTEERDSTTRRNAIPNTKDGKQQIFWWIIILVVVAVVIVLSFAAFYLLRGRRSKGNNQEMEVAKEVNLRMLSAQAQSSTLSENSFKAHKDDFVKQLKSKYADLTAAVYPVPYLRKKMYSVNDIFVDGGFEYLVSGEKWEALESYSEILSDPRLTSSRRIIEGEAGYGKSTLTLQFAYDWCNDVEESPLKQKDIFILLQLRHLRGIKSIFEAIKHCLLPRDSKFSSKDIERILLECKSVLLVLDGYDEYPDEDKEAKSFVISIINREIMQQLDVILTTRSSCLPKDYSPRTKRIRLRGFNGLARDSYLRKVLVGDDNNAVEKIKEKMRENPFLEDVCQVPLFYVLFAHLSTIKDKDTVLKFNSVTVFFRHIISCLHSHKKNKVTDDVEKKKFASYESEHSKLNEVAFEGLSVKSKQIIWEKKFIREKLGPEFYSHYINIGVLVEEEVLHIADDPGMIISQHIQYRQEVRFYHKLFCEWYAAHFLANHAARTDVILDPRNDEKEISSPREDQKLMGPVHTTSGDKLQNNILANLDPADVQYLYRFACGLNSVAAEKIYQYVTSKYGGDKFAILCIVEQTGKLEMIKPTIETLCASTVMFHHEHSKLLQRSTIQIMEIAAMQQIPISNIWLCNCFQEVTDSEKSLLLKSGLKLRQLHTLSALDVRENSREITTKESIGIINYCVHNRQLMTLRFKYCLMPRSIPVEQVNALQGKKITVLWDTGFGSVFNLNLESGLWQHQDDSTALTEEEYKEEADVYRKPKS